MTPEEQHIAIAQACGYTNVRKDRHGYLVGDGKADHCGIPDYLNDLNAMHEAENIYFAKCKTVDEQSLWLDTLAAVCGWKEAESLTEAKFISDLKCSRATAAQRAEAFLRTLGLWKESA